MSGSNKRAANEQEAGSSSATESCLRRSKRAHTSSQYVESGSSEEDLYDDEDYKEDHDDDDDDDIDDDDGLVAERTLSTSDTTKRLNISTTNTAKRYKYAATALKVSLKELLDRCIPDVKIVDLCVMGDTALCRELKKFSGHALTRKGISFPTCISVNERVLNVSPLSSDATLLASNDIIKINMACHMEGYVVTAAVTHVVTAEKSKGKNVSTIDAINAGRFVTRRDVLKHITPGMNVNEFRDLFCSKVEAYGCSILRFRCYKLEQYFTKIDAEDVPNIDSFEDNEVYVLDIITCNADAELKVLENEHPTVYRMVEPDKANEASRRILRDKFTLMPFVTRELEEGELETVMMDCNTLQSYPVACVDDGVITAHFKSTVFVEGDKVKMIAPCNLQRIKEGKIKEGMQNFIPSALVYCGKLAVGEEGSGEKPSISSISWNPEGEALQLACTGPFGTCVCTYSGIINRRSTGEANLEDGWDKVLLSEAPAKLCQWAPGTTNPQILLAVGSTVGHLDQGIVHLYDFSKVQKDNIPPGLSFRFQVGSGINSLSWNSKGAYLLATTNNSKWVAVIRKPRDFSTAKQLKFDKVELGYMKHPNPTKADFFGAFHPAEPYFFVVSSVGSILMYSLDKKAKSEGRLPWQRASGLITRRRFCGISISSHGDMLFCVSVDRVVTCYKINFDRLEQHIHWNIDELYSLDPSSYNIASTRLMGLLAMINDNGLITVYRDKGPKLEKLSQNELDVDVTRKFEELDVIDFHGMGLLASGGGDGLVHFWALQTSAGIKFSMKMRDQVSENVYYMKKQAQFGVAEELQRNLNAISTLYCAKINGLEGKLKEVSTVTSTGLRKLRQGQDISPDEMKKLLEKIQEICITE